MATPDRPGRLLSWRWLNELVDALRSCVLIPSATIGVRRTPGGQIAYLKAAQEAYWRITGGANPYGAIEQRALAGGTWADLAGGRTVTTSVDPLYEINGNATVAANTIVFAQRDITSGAWLFQRSRCSAASSPPGGTGPTPTPTPVPPAPPAPTPPTGPTPPANPAPPTGPVPPGEPDPTGWPGFPLPIAGQSVGGPTEIGGLVPINDRPLGGEGKGPTTQEAPPG